MVPLKNTASLLRKHRLLTYARSAHKCSSFQSSHFVQLLHFKVRFRTSHFKVACSETEVSEQVYWTMELTSAFSIVQSCPALCRRSVLHYREGRPFIMLKECSSLPWRTSLHYAEEKFFQRQERLFCSAAAFSVLRQQPFLRVLD